MPLKHMVKVGALISIFAIFSTLILAYTFDRTKDKVAANARAKLMQTLHALVPPDAHDNDLFQDTTPVTSQEYLGSKEPVTVYRARKNGNPVAVIFTATAPDGYSGNIRMVIAISYEGKLMGVRVIYHKETPGLGDFIEIERSDWISRFTGLSLLEPNREQWKVKKDGGVFDQFTGATITPRAVVNTVRKSLEYYGMHRDELFALSTTESLPHG